MLFNDCVFRPDNQSPDTRTALRHEHHPRKETRKHAQGKVHAPGAAHAAAAATTDRKTAPSSRPHPKSGTSRSPTDDAQLRASINAEAAHAAAAHAARVQRQNDDAQPRAGIDAAAAHAARGQRQNDDAQPRASIDAAADAQLRASINAEAAHAARVQRRNDDSQPRAGIDAAAAHGQRQTPQPVAHPTPRKLHHPHHIDDSDDADADRDDDDSGDDAGDDTGDDTGDDETRGEFDHQDARRQQRYLATAGSSVQFGSPHRVSHRPGNGYGHYEYPGVRHAPHTYSQPYQHPTYQHPTYQHPNYHISQSEYAHAVALALPPSVRQYMHPHTGSLPQSAYSYYY